MDDCKCEKCRVKRWGRFGAPIINGMPQLYFHVCPKCGNKRCPHNFNHENDCTNSNATQQIGSADGIAHG